jgi:hypothetical protein
LSSFAQWRICFSPFAFGSHTADHLNAVSAIQQSIMPMHPHLTYTVYVIAAIVFVGMLTWMFVYSSRLKDRQITRDLKGREPQVPEEGILLATREKEHRGVPKP